MADQKSSLLALLGMSNCSKNRSLLTMFRPVRCPTHLDAPPKPASERIPERILECVYGTWHHRLTVLAVTRAKPGMHSDGGGLWLRVQPTVRAWLFRYTSPTTGRERRMGLGSSPDVTLADARSSASDARKQLVADTDPLDQRAAVAADLARELITFQKVAEACMEAKRAGWRNEKNEAQWTATLKAYVYSQIGGRPVEKIS